MDVDLRKVRYFVAVAEELHFGRAAERLHIAQPVLSRQIWALEDELKVQLFVRSKRSTELNSAGCQLLEDARAVLASAEAMRRRTVEAAHPQRTFTIAFLPGITVTPLIRIADLAEEHLLQDPDAVPEWRDRAVELREDRPRAAPHFRSIEEKLEHVAAGHGVSIIPCPRQRSARAWTSSPYRWRISGRTTLRSPGRVVVGLEPALRSRPWLRASPGRSCCSGLSGRVSAYRLVGGAYRPRRTAARWWRREQQHPGRRHSRVLRRPARRLHGIGHPAPRRPVPPLQQRPVPVSRGPPSRPPTTRRPARSVV
ncbi:LysR family transcriptional regulator [Kribbella sp. DT2]|uniref:LysR family transcriptional regulator n=1 Tax=Kribbella sp. DT2 TaxID=3393427 RepID=UPI003CE68B12